MSVSSKQSQQQQIKQTQQTQQLQQTQLQLQQQQQQIITTKLNENEKLNNSIEILRKEINLIKLNEFNKNKSENIVIKNERIQINQEEITIRRVYILYGLYRVGWVLDSDINYCMECQNEFTFFNRKHHCRACGNVICSTCSPYKANLPTLDEINGSRVCINCFGLKVNPNNLRHYAPLDEFDSFETASTSDDHASSTYSAGELLLTFIFNIFSYKIFLIFIFLKLLLLSILLLMNRRRIKFGNFTN